MAAVPQKLIAITRVDMDSDETRIEQDAVTYVKGWTGQVDLKPTGERGFNRGAATPREGCKIQTDALTLPEGESYCIGSFESRELNQLYVFCWNQLGNHFIYRVNGSDGTAQMVYMSKYLNFRLDQQQYISEGRCTIKSVRRFDKATNRVETRIFLIFVEYNQPRMISVEDSIATNSFDYAAFPYFDPLTVNPDEIDDALEKYINLAVGTPMKCITVTAQNRFPSEENLQNLMIYQGWQWRVKFIDVYNRESEHGVISDRYYTIIGGGCATVGSGLPRCVRLKIDAGNPFTDKIQIEFRTCSGGGDLTQDSDWFVYDTIDKYDNSVFGKFWTRPILNPWQKKFDQMTAAGNTPDEIAEAVASLTKYNSTDNSFEYTFCGDKQCLLIPVSETARTDNAIPRNSSTVFPLNEGICLANNLRGFEPVNPSEIEKIHVEAVTPAASCDEFELRKIVVYILIHCPWYQHTGILKHTQNFETTAEQSPESDCGGGANPVNYPFRVLFGMPDDFHIPDQQRMGQYFPDQQDGWIVYLAGTPYYAVTEQVKINTSTFEECPQGVFVYNAFDAPWTGRCSELDGVVMQKAELLVPAGKYVVRVAHHRTKPTDDYQRTSTLIQGRKAFSGIPNLGAGGVGAMALSVDDYIKEMYADVTTGDFINHNQAFVCQDGTVDEDQFGVVGAILGEAYLLEDELGRVPVEYQPMIDANLQVTGNTHKYTAVFTDHNGYYYSIAGAELRVAVDRCNPPDPNYPFYHPGLAGEPLVKVVCMKSPHANQLATVFMFAGQDRFPDKDRRVVTGKTLMCGFPDSGIGGVPVVPYYAQPAITNGDGEWVVVLHGRSGWGSGAGPSPRPQTDYFQISQGVCMYADCLDPCVFSFPLWSLAYQSCQPTIRKYDLGSKRLALRGVNKSGPQTGGRYQVGAVFHDGNGRHDYVQTGEHLFVDIPSLLDTHAFVFSELHFSIDPSFIAPPWAEWMTLVMTSNLKWDNFFSWSADRIAYVDVSGHENATTPAKVRVYYESMVEYAIQNNLPTGAVWDFIAAGAEGQSIVGDVVEFYRKGDGTWLDKSILYTITYDKDGKYFELDYDSNLADLKSGTLFKVMRPKICASTELFREVCPSIRIVNRVPQVLTGMFSYRDSFFLQRQFPVPTYIPDPNNAGSVIKTVNTRNSVFAYEHHSPSDKWGYHCWTRGRIFVKNPYEREQYQGMEFALSKPLLNRSNFNGISYFDIADITNFDEQEWGSVTVALPEINTILVICKRNNFIVGFSDTNVKVDAVGNVYAGSALGKFGQPQRKIGQNYGCQSTDINTIRKFSGVVVFLDRAKGDLVFHVYTQAMDVGVTGFRGWLADKIAFQNQRNDEFDRLYNHYFVGGIDPQTNEYYLTSVRMPYIYKFGDPAELNYSLPDTFFVNKQAQPFIALNETIVVDLVSATMKGFAGFTPEYYGRLEGFHLGNNILCMRRSHGWSLHAGDALYPRNNYFGEQTKKVIEFICNVSPERVKQFMWLEIYIESQQIFATKITTQSGQLSRIHASWFKKVNNFYCAEFLCDQNTPPDPNLPDVTATHVLLDGDPLTGRWARIRLEGNDMDEPRYCELNAIVTYVIPLGLSAD